MTALSVIWRSSLFNSDPSSHINSDTPLHPIKSIIQFTMNKSVQKDLARRLSELIDDEKKDAQQQYVRETLCRALAEVRDAQESGTALPDAKLLFDDIEKRSAQ